MRSTNWFSVLIFVLGVVAGIGGMAFVCPEVQSHFSSKSQATSQPAQPTTPEAFVAVMQKRLDLSSSQTVQFASVVSEAMRRIDDFHKRIMPDYDRIKTEECDKIRAMLNPDQRVKFEQWLSEYEKEHAKHPHGG